MDSQPSSHQKDQSGDAPAPEVLKPRSEGSESSGGSGSGSAGHNHEATVTHKADADKQPHRHRTYRPSHKATFIGLAVVVAILAINAAVISFLLKGQSKNGPNAQGQVTISQSVLDKLGVNRSAVGDDGAELVVGPDTEFDGTVKIGEDVSIAGQLDLNNKLSASDASLAQLEAGNTSLNQLNVNGNSTVSSLNLRNDLLVTGTTRLQGAVTLTQLLTVNNNENVSDNLTVGGELSADSLIARSIASTSTLTIGGHIITSGSAPGVSSGSGVGSNGTVSISGNDSAGTVAVNIGTGSGGGLLASVTFRYLYSSTPSVVVTPVGGPIGNWYITRSASGFSIYVSGSPAPGAYAFDYEVEQ